MITSTQLKLCGGALAVLLLAACNRNNPTDTTSPAAAPPPAATAPAPGMAPASTAPMTPAPAMPASTAPAPAGSAPATNGGGMAAAAAPTGLQVAGLKLGDSLDRNQAVGQATTTFKPSQDTIYASVDTTGRTDGATLSARFSYLEGKGQPITAISQTLATEGPATTTFKLHNPDAWPQGSYRVEIALDGKPVTSRTFEVKGA